MSNHRSKQPAFFEPVKTERQYRVYVPDAFELNMEDAVKGSKKLPERYMRRLKHWKEIDRTLFRMDGKNQPPLPRILVTGSRDWDDVPIIRNSLEYYQQYLEAWAWASKEMAGLMAPGLGNYKAILVSGNCPSGADLIAETIATGLGWEVERWPALWIKDGKKDPNAGFLRNEYIVTQREPDICLAFQRNKSNGTADCISRALRENIFTVVHELQDTTTKWS